MKTIIAGSRDITDPAMLDAALCAWGWRAEITAVVCGEARGVDALGKAWALDHGIPVLSYPADWKTHGKAAGPIRNEAMADVADALLALWDGQSSGTRHMIGAARTKQAQLKSEGRTFRIYVYTVGDWERRQRVLARPAVQQKEVPRW